MEFEESAPPSGLRRRWWLLLIPVLLAAGAWVAWNQRSRPQSTGEFLCVQLEEGDVVQTVRSTGSLNPVRTVQVGSQVSGNIQQLFADFNSPVREGQLIARLDTATFDANVRLAESELESALAGAQLRQVEEQRLLSLLDRELVSQADADEAEAMRRQAEALVNIRRASLEKARLELERCFIHSPTDGVVISRNVDVGQTVAASLAAPVLFEIADSLSRMKINAHVPEADIGRVREGQRVEFRVDAFRDTWFHGVVAQVRHAPILVQNVVTYDTVVLVDNPDLLLKPGMTAEVFIVLAERSGVLRLRNAALRTRLPPEIQPPAVEPPRSDPNLRPVYRLGEDGALTMTWVETGISDGTFTEIRSGLSPGDRVVTGLAPTPERRQRNTEGGGLLQSRPAQF